MFKAVEGARPPSVVMRVSAICERCMRHIDYLSPTQRRGVAVTFSVLLHVGVLLLMLQSPKGFLSIGTTGLGDINGAGAGVTLVDVSELTPPQAAQQQMEAPAEDQAKPVEPPIEADAADTKTPSEPAEAAELVSEQVATTERQPVSSDSQVPSDSYAPATAGAFGQNGESYTNLWNAIAPCWNRIADLKTLPATLIISFDVDGGLSAPPVIEREVNSEITDDSLHAEAKALQALSECGAYPMAKGLQNVSVRFPSPR